MRTVTSEALPVGEDVEEEDSDADNPDSLQTLLCVSVLVFNKKCKR
jgi:hypothetical protein